MRVAIHQPNFVPHFGFFYKMSQCDIFVVLSQVQFEKNGYQNRFFIQKHQRWVSMPINHGMDPIYKKRYTNGLRLDLHNIMFIKWMADTLSIEARIVPDVVTNASGTQRLLDNLNFYGATTYITHPSAKDKYLDEQLLKTAGIDVEYSDHQYAKWNIMEMLEEFGVEGTRKQLFRPKIIQHVPQDENT